MTISLEPQPGRRGVYLLTIDGETFREIHSTVYGKRPRFPTCPTREEFEEKFAAIEYGKAREYAMRRLAARSYHSEQLSKLMQSRGIDNGVIRCVLDDFQEKGYLSDADWVASFVRAQRSRHTGPEAIKQKLFVKGVAPEVIEEAVGGGDVRESIRHLLRTKYAKRDMEDYREKQKVVAALMRRGFRGEDIFACID